MEKKKVIGVDINEILRHRWVQMDKFYAEEFEEGMPPDDEAYVYDIWDKYKWEDTEEEIQLLKEEEDMPDINAKHYQIDEKTGKSEADAFIFQEKEIVKHTAREVYNRFMYQDYCFEIFGTAPKMYKQVDLDFDQFYKKFKTQFEVIIVSKENVFSIPPTLFFLSRVTSRVKKYVFAESNEEIWDAVDYLITTDPELLEAPEGKGVVKLNRPYNEDIEVEVTGVNIFDLMKHEGFLSMIGYVNPVENELEENKKED